MDASENLQGILAFLSLDRESLTRFATEKHIADSVYLLDDTELVTGNPLFALTYIVWQKISGMLSSTDNELFQILMDVEVVLLLMVEQKNVYEYLWITNRETDPVTGPMDRVWDTLRRMAEAAIRELNGIESESLENLNVWLANRRYDVPHER